MFQFGLTIFWSAFLLFQVQPIIGKKILPWFGGTPVVWTTCMLFFQVFLLGGYAYAHFLTTRFSRRNQAVVHSIVMAVSLVIAALKLWVFPADFLKPHGDESPLFRILGLLAFSIGAQYFVLASTAPLLQNWFSLRYPGRSPYRLYALSNFGSLLALLSYPIAIEPKWALATQTYTWMGGYAVFACLCALVAFYSGEEEPSSERAFAERSKQAAASALRAEAPRPHFIDRCLWILLPMCGSMLMISTTNQLSQDVAVFPFLWVIVLALYLVTFILCFDSDIWYWRPVWGLTLVCSFCFATYLVFKGVEGEMSFQLIGYLLAMFVGCMVCHGELARLRPDPKYLTSFYLSLSVGGALGGLFITLAATALFRSYWEYHISLFLCAMLFGVCMRRINLVTGSQKTPDWAWGIYMMIGGVWATFLIGHLYDESKKSVYQTRNFFGVITIREDNKDDETWHQYTLMNGRINHGMQFRNPAKRLLKTSYYSENSGIGIACRFHPNRVNSGNQMPMKIAVVGLGTGSSAAWAEAGDSIRFYEINPDVINIPEKYFSYRSDTRAEVKTILGDARIKMEQEAAAKDFQDFDVLVIDAFSGDSIPVHLLTKECMGIYLQHMHKHETKNEKGETVEVDDGIIAFHISNRFIDLAPVVRSLAKEYKMEAVYIDCNDDDSSKQESSSTWVLVTRNAAFLSYRDEFEKDFPKPPVMKVKMFQRPEYMTWTDDYSNLFGLLKWGSETEDFINEPGETSRAWWKSIKEGVSKYISKAPKTEGSEKEPKPIDP